MKFFGRGFLGLVFLAVGILMVGCQSPETDKFPVIPDDNAPATQGTATNVDLTGTILHVNEAIVVSFSDSPTPIQPIEDTIKQDGSITLIYNQKFQAAGKTVGALQEEIRERYVPTYFKYLTASIKTGDRFFTVAGEVRMPNRQAYVTTMTVLRAIATAGGFTDFAAKTRVELTRAGGKKPIIVDCKKARTHPELDLEVYPGDIINVPKRWL